MPTGGITVTCLATGLVAGAAVAFRVRRRHPARKGIATAAFHVLATIIGAVLAASAISVFHIPTGH
jgi:hypothetical protein